MPSPRWQVGKQPCPWGWHRSADVQLRPTGNKMQDSGLLGQRQTKNDLP